MNTRRFRAGLLIAEVIVCFSIPGTTLLWGILTLPMWYSAWMRGGTYAAWSLFAIAAGCFGFIALIAFLRYAIEAQERRTFPFARNIALGILGLIAVWGDATTRFKFLELSLSLVITAIVPTLCSAHLVFLAWRKSQSST